MKEDSELAENGYPLLFLQNHFLYLIYNQQGAIPSCFGKYFLRDFQLWFNLHVSSWQIRRNMLFFQAFLIFHTVILFYLFSIYT
jgi:hypothetical protein